jgi:hypothetical protein
MGKITLTCRNYYEIFLRFGLPAWAVAILALLITWSPPAKAIQLCPSAACFSVQIIDGGTCDCNSHTTTFQYQVTVLNNINSCIFAEIEHTDLTDKGFCSSITNVMSGNSNLPVCSMNENEDEADVTTGEDEEMDDNDIACYQCLPDNDPGLNTILLNDLNGIQTGAVLKLDEEIESGNTVIYKITLGGCNWTTMAASAFIKANLCGFEIPGVPVPVQTDVDQCGPSGGGGGGGATGGGGEAQCVEPGAVTGSGPGGCGGGVCSNLQSGSFNPNIVGGWLVGLLVLNFLAGLVRRKVSRRQP